MSNYLSIFISLFITQCKYSIYLPRMCKCMIILSPGVKVLSTVCILRTLDHTLPPYWWLSYTFTCNIPTSHTCIWCKYLFSFHTELRKCARLLILKMMYCIVLLYIWNSTHDFPKIKSKSDTEHPWCSSSQNIHFTPHHDTRLLYSKIVPHHTRYSISNFISDN